MKLVSQILAVAAVATLVVPAIAQTSTMSSKPMMKKPMSSSKKMAMHNNKMIMNNRTMIKKNHKMIKKVMMKSSMKPMTKPTM